MRLPLLTLGKTLRRVSWFNKTMNRSIAYMVIFIVFASSMGFFIRSVANKAIEENASVFNSAQINTETRSNDDTRVNMVEPSTSSTLTIKGTTLVVEIADDALERSQGLSGRASLQQNSGMLFLFEAPFVASFWMKDMNFALDFIWIRDNTIVDITENVPAPKDDNLPSYQPNQPVDAVLEVNAGWVVEHGGKNALLGERVTLYK